MAEALKSASTSAPPTLEQNIIADLKTRIIALEGDLSLAWKDGHVAAVLFVGFFVGYVLGHFIF